MRQRLQPNLDRISSLNTSGLVRAPSANELVQNMTVYGLPFKEPVPTQFLARYLCNKLVWKKTSNLVLDVLVATVSLFMAYWSLLHFVLRQLAVAYSPHGNSFSSSEGGILMDSYATIQATTVFAPAAANYRFM